MPVGDTITSERFVIRDKDSHNYGMPIPTENILLFRSTKGDGSGIYDKPSHYPNQAITITYPNIYHIDGDDLSFIHIPVIIQSDSYCSCVPFQFVKARLIVTKLHISFRVKNNLDQLRAEPLFSKKQCGEITYVISISSPTMIILQHILILIGISYTQQNSIPQIGSMNNIFRCNRYKYENE